MTTKAKVLSETPSKGARLPHRAFSEVNECMGANEQDSRLKGDWK